MRLILKIRSLLYCNFSTVLVCLIIFTIGTKLSVGYLDRSQLLISPERQFASPKLGRDISAYTVQPVYDIRNGKVPFIFGYGSVTVADIAMRPLEFLHVCSINTPVTCDYVLFVGLVIAGILGFLLLIFSMANDEKSRVFMLLIFCIMLLGVPYAKAIEAGNLDMILAVIYGWILFVVITVCGQSSQKSQSILIGMLLGLLLSTKAFFILFVGFALLMRYKDLYVYGAFIVSFAFTSLWPRIYGVPAGLFDVFRFAMRGSDAFGPQLYTQINYGNNAIVSYVSNMLQMIDTGYVSLPLHVALTHIGSMLIGCFIFIQPFFAEGGIRIICKLLPKKNAVTNLGLRTAGFAILICTYATVFMVLLPAWSYDYRLLYLLPVIFIILQKATKERTKELLYWSIIMLTLKSMWIPKDRLLNIFLYAHLYLLLRTSISLWKEFVEGSHTSR